MKTILFRITIAALLSLSFPAVSADFFNLDFEAAQLPILPGGEFGTFEPASEALPGWHVFAGDREVSLVLHNNLTLGTAAVSVFGPNWAGTIFEGQYDIVMRPGAFGIDGRSVDMSIAQTGLIPEGMQSLQFFGESRPGRPSTAQRFGVYVNGQELNAFTLSSTPDHEVDGVDVSGFAGQQVDFKITSFSLEGEFNALHLDALNFSPMAVPEPGDWALYSLVATALALDRARRRRSS